MADGTGGLSIGDLNDALTFLNVFYLEAGIEFYWKDFPNTVDNDDYFEFNQAAPDGDTENDLAGLFPTATDAVNIYFVNNIFLWDGSNAGGYAYYPADAAYSNRIVMTHYNTLYSPNGTFVHELGHYFNLIHTHQGTENGPESTNAENVPRSGANSNCSSKGDLLCDTEADPRHSGLLFDEVTCSYTGEATDINGVAYTPPIDNIMSYYPDECGGLFTPDQYTRITQGLIIRQGHSAYGLNAPAMNVAVATGLTASLNGGSVDLSWMDNATNETGYLIERSITSAVSGFKPLLFGSTPPNSSEWSDPSPIGSTTNWYRIKPSNGNCNAYSNVIAVEVGLTYCEPEYFMTCSTGPPVLIDAFTLVGESSTIANINSNCSPGGFGNFHTQLADLLPGSSYNLSISRSVEGLSTYPAFAQVWIDLDRNGSFEDADEKLLPIAGYMAPDFSGTLEIPLWASPGLTRLRVRCWDTFNGIVYDPTSCSPLAFGETEEYTVEILNPPVGNVSLIPKVFLDGPYNATTGIMSDDLRSAGLIPLTEPYSELGYTYVGGGGETISPFVPVLTGNDAIVDWVIVELRDPLNSTIVAASQAALLQRDGDVVGTNGFSPVAIPVAPGAYYVVIRHRNHLACMTADPQLLYPLPVIVDFTSNSLESYGTSARRSIGAVQALWAGDVNFDSSVKYTGAGNDRDPILSAIGGIAPTNVLNGQYSQEDVNMNGQVKYTGSMNDRDLTLQTVGGVVPTNIRVAQLP